MPAAPVGCATGVDWIAVVDCSAGGDCGVPVDCGSPVDGNVPEACGAGRAWERVAHSAVARSVKPRVDSIVADGEKSMAEELMSQWPALSNEISLERSVVVD